MHISMSLYGSNPKYLMGAIANASLRDKIYPEWKFTIFYDSEVPSETLRKLSDFQIELIPGESLNIANPMIWRFSPAFVNQDKVVIVRDADSRFSEREALAVREWMFSKKTLHVMRDHPMHEAPILGGMWGIQGVTPDLSSEILTRYAFKGNYGEDQRFLAEEIYDKYKNDLIAHDEYFCFDNESRRFPKQRVRGQYVGESLSASSYPELKRRIRSKNAVLIKLLRAKLCLRSNVKKILRRYKCLKLFI